jgi:anti-anti-sigma regulatory factor
MTGIHRNPPNPLLIAPGDLHELVRGQEQEFVERMTPIVRKQSVTLDFAQIERIDAAGIAALISLYGSAQTAGHHFNVVNACPHVVEILTLVSLDRILILPAAVTRTGVAQCMAQPAA